MADNCNVCGKPLPDGVHGTCEECIYGKQNKEPKVAKLHVTVDSKQMEDAIKGKQEAEEKALEYKEKLELVAEVQLENKMKQLGIPESERDFYREDPARIEGYERGKATHGTTVKDFPTGSAPLEGNIRYAQGNKEGYDSMQEMIDDLRARSHAGDKQAEAILGKLLLKSLTGVRDQKSGMKEYIPTEGQDLTELERLRKNFRERKLKERGNE